MAKKKHKKAGKGDAAIPKVLKEAGAELLAKANTPAGREALMSGLAMLATAAAARAASRAHAKPDVGAGDADSDKAAGAAETKAETPPVFEALGAAANAFFAKLNERPR